MNISDHLEQVIALASSRFKNAKDAMDFVRKVREVAIQAGESPADWPDEVPDWVAQLPGGSYDLRRVLGQAED